MLNLLISPFIKLLILGCISPKNIAAKISRNTLDLWLKRRDESGTVAPKVRTTLTTEQKLKDLVAFKQFAQENGHLTAVRMAEVWPEPISDATIGKALKKIGFTRKKTYGCRERNDAKRAAFLQECQIVA